MSTELRKSGIDIVGDIPWGTHFCQFYTTASDLLDILVPYFSAGLEANEFCMWITSEPVDKGAAKKALAKAVPDLDRRLRAGQIEFMSHDEWYLAGGRFDVKRVLDAWASKLKEARGRGYDGLRLSGNTSWLEKKEWKVFVAYEAAIDEVIGRSRILALCTYSLERCGAREVLDVVRNRRFALARRESKWEVVESAENKRARQVERRLAQFPEQNPHPVLRVDRSGNILYANPSARRFLAGTGEAAGDALPLPVGEIAARAFAQEAMVEAEISDGEGRAHWFTAIRPPGEAYVNLYSHDVTTRRLAEKALRKSEAKYRSLFESMTEGFALYELIEDDQGRPVDWRILEVNEAYARHTGVPRATVAGRRVSEIFPDVYEEYLPTFARVVAAQTPAEFETYARTVDRYMHIVTFPLGGRLFASLIEDISARRKTEQALLESEKQLERSQEIAHLGSWELDLTADRLTWSDEVFRIFGLRPQEFSATYEAFLAAVHPDDREAVDKAYRDSLHEGRDSYEIEHRIVRRNSGEVRTVHEKCEHIRDAAGRIVRSVGMVHDITEQKRAESLRQALVEQERLRLGAAVEQASEAVIMADPDGRILYVNAAFEKINRLSKGAAWGRNYFGLIGDDARADEMRGAAARGEAWSGRIILARPDERPVTLEIVATAVPEPPGILITERDVTQEVVLQEQVRQAQKLEALGTLAGGIAHDFNNILGAITINTELALLDTEEGCRARESLPLILRAAERGKELVKQIVTFSRQREWERNPLRIAPVVQEALELFRATLPGSVVMHETIGAENAAVQAHPAQIHQILSNLCQNASLAMRGKPGQLEVKLETVQVDAPMASRHSGLKPGPYVRLAVADSGCGMSREVLGRVFEPFFTTRSPGEGSGLGLSVVHGIVKSYGGAITAYSEAGGGSTFSVFLPLLPEDAAAPETTSAPAAETGSERILLVDDDLVQLKSLARMLERLGYKVTARSTGRTAATAFKRSPEAFDLVVTDQTMPRMSGIDLAKSLVQVRPDIPIILNTGFSEKVNGETVGYDGIRAFIMKPFTARELSALIRKVLKGEKGKDPQTT